MPVVCAVAALQGPPRGSMHNTTEEQPLLNCSLHLLEFRGITMRTVSCRADPGGGLVNPRCPRAPTAAVPSSACVLIPPATGTPLSLKHQCCPQTREPLLS